MGVVEFFEFLVVTIVFVALVLVLLSYKQLKPYVKRLLGFKPAPGETSTSKPGSLDWGNADRPRSTSVSSEDLA